MNLDLPTPVTPWPLPGAGAELWIKRDDHTSPVYGGNKARKLGPLLAEARARGASRLLTVGALGSHHVLATALFGRAAGFAVEAVMVPQPLTAHAARNFRAALAAGLTVHAAASWPGAALALLRERRGAFFITVGGSNATGSRPYVAAAHELAAQVRSGVCPEPDAIVVTVGSGGTAAGLAVGLVEAGLTSVVHGIVVATPAGVVEQKTARLVASLGAPEVAAAAVRRILFDRRYLGGGYGYATPWGARARMLALRAGLGVDTTYTAKSLAAALDLAADRRYRHVLYWHTLSAAPLDLTHAPSPEECGVRYPALFRGAWPEV